MLLHHRFTIARPVYSCDTLLRVSLVAAGFMPPKASASHNAGADGKIILPAADKDRL